MATLTIEITDIPPGSPLASMAREAERAELLRIDPMVTHAVSTSHMNLVYMLALDVEAEARRIHGKRPKPEPRGTETVEDIGRPLAGLPQEMAKLRWRLLPPEQHEEGVPAFEIVPDD